MNNPNPQSTTNRSKQIAASKAVSITTGIVLGAVLGNIAMRLAVGILFGGAGVL
jgi:hypothetical protein